MPRPEDSDGPSHPRQIGCSRVAFGVRSNPRRPQQAPCRSGTSTSGDAAPPAAYRIRCLRLVHLVHRVPTTPPWTQDSIQVGGEPLPDRDSHPARDAKLSWRNNARRQQLPEAGAQRTLEAVSCTPWFGWGCPSRRQSPWYAPGCPFHNPTERHCACLLDHLIRQYEEVRREGQAKRPSRLEVEDQLVLRRLLHREVGGLHTLQDLVHVGSSPSEQVG